MPTKVIKTYTNWDREDADFPYMKTFSPWMRHSFANGLRNVIGNNKEYTSESDAILGKDVYDMRNDRKYRYERWGLYPFL